MRDAAFDALIYLFVLIKRFEGCKLVPYLDCAGIWTCGWGSTGPDVFPGRAWTQEYADRRMAQDALKFARGVLALCPGLEGKRLAAAADLAYNVGLTAFRSSTARRRLSEGLWESARQEFMRWVRAGGKVQPGLVLRRRAEADMLV